jgi:hypothetical protein
MRYGSTRLGGWCGLGSLLLLAAGLLAFTSRTNPAPTESPAVAVMPAPIPEPPCQHDPWVLPKTSAVPEAFIRATARLFDDSFADPRGCEYRHIRVEVESRDYGEADVVATHGWVLPAVPDAPERFAVCWNGLVYPALSIGEPATVEVDVYTALRRSDVVLHEGVPNSEEGYSVDYYGQRTDTAVALLLRLGKGALADVIWTRRQTPGEAPEELSAVHYYARAAKAQAETKSARAEAAFVRGGDYAASNDRRPIICFGPGRHPNPDVRIASLIERLDGAVGQPTFACYQSRISFANDPIVRALVREGDRAVGPLLRCMVRDRRMTSAIELPSHNPATPHRMRAVREAAYEALAAILDIHPDSSDSALDGATTEHWCKWAKEFREARRQGYGPERWLRTLADDRENPLHWLTAAEKLASISHPWHPPGWSIPSDESRRPKIRPMPGEPVRWRRNPSVTELLVVRINQIGNNWLAGRLALCLVEWDLPAATPVLEVMTRRLADAATHADPATEPDEEGHDKLMRREGEWAADELFLKLSEARLAAGDRRALDDYAAWLERLPPGRVLRGKEGEYFRLMAANPDHPSLARASDRMFGAAGSPWLPLVHRSGDVFPADRIRRLFAAGLLATPGFRGEVLRMLTDLSPCGTIRRSDNLIRVEIPEQHGDAYYLDECQPPFPEDGAVFELHVCEYIARLLNGDDRGHFTTVAGRTIFREVHWPGIPSSPRCEPFWPTQLRTEAVLASADFLARYGCRLHQRELKLRRLDAPASVEQLRHGEAVFSLNAEGQARIVPLPSDAPPARWKVLPDSSQTGDHQGLPRWALYGLAPPDLGMVWQAEEVFAAGRWQRYFGFVGGHRIARVPAAEIEFLPPAGGAWTRCAGPFNARLDLPPASNPDADEPSAFAPGEAVPIVLRIHNSAGLDQRLPGEAPKLLLSYSPAHVSRQGALAPTARGNWEWVDVPASPNARPVALTKRTLGPAESIHAAEFDLRDLFDLSEPGFYRVRLAGAKRDGPRTIAAARHETEFLILPPHPSR